MHLGRSDRIDGTSHILPRGMGMDVTGVDPTQITPPACGRYSTLVVQLHDTQR